MKILGIGTRVLNFLIDTSIIFLLNMLVCRAYNWQVMYYDYPIINYWIFFAATLFIYYFISETFFKRTIGKLLTYSKVVNTVGAKPTLLQILFRSLCRVIIIDMFFIPFLDMPLHDYVSKTRLVEV